MKGDDKSLTWIIISEDDISSKVDLNDSISSVGKSEMKPTVSEIIILYMILQIHY